MNMRLGPLCSLKHKKSFESTTQLLKVLVFREVSSVFCKMGSIFDGRHYLFNKKNHVSSHIEDNKIRALSVSFFLPRSLPHSQATPRGTKVILGPRRLSPVSPRPHYSSFRLRILACSISILS